MSDPRDPRPSATPYRELAPRPPTPIVRYALAGPEAITIAATMAAAVVSIAGWVAITHSHNSEATGGGLATLAVIAVSFVVPLVFVVGEGPCRHEVRVEVDRAAGTLLLRRMRWPLRSRVRAFPLVRVTDAVVQSEDDGEAVRYMVFVLIEGEAPVPLVEGMWDPAQERLEKTAVAIRALLPPRSPPRPDHLPEASRS